MRAGCTVHEVWGFQCSCPCFWALPETILLMMEDGPFMSFLSTFRFQWSLLNLQRKDFSYQHFWRAASLQLFIDNIYAWEKHHKHQWVVQNLATRNGIQKKRVTRPRTQAWPQPTLRWGSEFASAGRPGVAGAGGLALGVGFFWSCRRSFWGFLHFLQLYNQTRASGFVLFWGCLRFRLNQFK